MTIPERNMKYNTIKNYRNIIQKYVKPKLGQFAVRNIKPATMQTFIDEVSSDKNPKTNRVLSKHTVEIIMTVVKEAFKRAVFPYQILRDNPVGYVEMPRYEPTKVKTRDDLKIITYDQYQNILEVMPPAQPFHMPLVIAFNTGMRRGEVLRLTWNHVNWADSTIKVVQQMIQKGNDLYELETPKSASGFRTIAIGPTLIEELRKQRERQMNNRMLYGQL